MESSRRGKKVLNKPFVRQQQQCTACAVVGRGGKSLPCHSGSELRLSRRGREKIRGENDKRDDTNKQKEEQTDIYRRVTAYSEPIPSGRSEMASMRYGMATIPRYPVAWQELQAQLGADRGCTEGI